MAMDPKQERVLRDGTASEADQPRRVDRQAVRAQAERPPIDEKPRRPRRTAAVADVRVNLPSGTPVEQLARAGGAERVPELGRSRSDDARTEASPSEDVHPARETNGHPIVDGGEARRVLVARREHSKGDGNFPNPEPGPDLLDERTEDRTPRDLPKARDDRSAPKGNVTAGQSDRNPTLEVRDDERPQRPRRSRPAPDDESSARRNPAASDRAPKKATAQTRSQAAKRRKTTTRTAGAGGRSTRKKNGAGKSPQSRAAAARGSVKPRTKRGTRGGGPRGGAGATRGGKR